LKYVLGIATWGKKVGRKWDQLKRSDSSETVGSTGSKWSPGRVLPPTQPTTAHKNKRVSRVESLRYIFARGGQRGGQDGKEWIKEECQKGISDLYRLNSLLAGSDEVRPRDCRAGSIETVHELPEPISKCHSQGDLSEARPEKRANSSDKHRWEGGPADRPQSVGSMPINLRTQPHLREIYNFLSNFLSVKSEESGYESDSTRAGLETPRPQPHLPSQPDRHPRKKMLPPKGIFFFNFPHSSV
jgi:hypothetical protein